MSDQPTRDERSGGQPEPCLADGGQSMGVWIYCDLPVGHDDPKHWGWRSQSTFATNSPDRDGYRDRCVAAVRVAWEDDE